MEGFLSFELLLTISFLTQLLEAMGNMSCLPPFPVDFMSWRCSPTSAPETVVDLLRWDQGWTSPEDMLGPATWRACCDRQPHSAKKLLLIFNRLLLRKKKNLFIEKTNI